MTVLLCFVILWCCWEDARGWPSLLVVNFSHQFVLAGCYHSVAIVGPQIVNQFSACYWGDYLEELSTCGVRFWRLNLGPLSCWKVDDFRPIVWDMRANDDHSSPNLTTELIIHGGTPIDGAALRCFSLVLYCCLRSNHDPSCSNSVCEVSTLASL